MDKIFGVDKALYKVTALKDKKRVATMKVVAHSKLEAYYSCREYFPYHNGFDYDHIKFTYDSVGVILEKNDLKRKRSNGEIGSTRLKIYWFKQPCRFDADLDY